MFKKINEWFANVLPGYKTRILAVLTAVSGGAVVFLDMFNAVDLKPLFGTYGPYVMMGVGVLSYWFRHLTDVKANA